MQKPKYDSLKAPDRWNGSKFTGAQPERYARTTKNAAQKGNPARTPKFKP